MGPRASWVSGDRSARGGPRRHLRRSHLRAAGAVGWERQGPQPEEGGARKDAPDGAAREASGSRRRGAAARPSAGIMTRGGRTTPRPARPPRRAIGSGAGSRGGQWAGPADSP